MITSLRIAICGVGIWLLAIAAGWIVVPETLAMEFGISLQGAQGLSTGRGDIGGMFLAGAILCFLGARDHPSAPWYLYAFAMLMLTVAFGRLVGFVFDEVVLQTIAPFVIELVFAGLACWLAGLLRSRSTDPVV